MALNAEASPELSRFLARLAERHPSPDTVFALRLAETGVESLDRPPAPAAAVAVIGPTQTGKSAVVNVLAGGDFVETSPLAAHTRRAELLAVNTAPDAAHLPASLTTSIGVEPRAVESDRPPCLIWDTPDFDSNAAAAYRQQVARVCALADLLVVVLSKEKYADQSVWEVLEAVAPLEIPAVVCLNKCENEAESDVLLPVIRRRLDEHPAASSLATVVALSRAPDGESDRLWTRLDAGSLCSAVFDYLRPRTPERRSAGLHRLLRDNWDAWTEPVERELDCRREWRVLLDEQTRSFMARYRFEYVEHSRHYDVARKAVLGLLELLEIPALAGPMSRMRRTLTWPFRRLGESLGRPSGTGRDQELEVLEAAVDHYLLSLRSEVAGRRHPWWRALESELAEREPALRRAFLGSVDRYRQAFQPRIDDLSEQLYEQLKHNPVTLNALRATRISADAGGIVLAFKTGTLGLYDALFAPAVISVTSYLTESAVGQYLRSVIAGLKREQVAQVDSIIRHDVQEPLGRLQPQGEGLFGLDEEDLERARSRMEALA